MPRGTLVVDEKLLRDHFLRQQRGGNISGYRGARFQTGYGSSYDEESVSETPQTSDEIYWKRNFVKHFEEINEF
jgi:hypothetical protein